MTINNEDQLSAAFYRWAWNTYPAARRCFWHVPNELARIPGETAKSHLLRIQQAKAIGTLKGAHDWHILWHRRFYTIELKFGNNILSNDQKLFQKAIEAQGAICYTCWNVDEAKTAFVEIMASI